MDELKDSSQAASFEQKDPLVVYKMEAYKLFEELIFTINESVTSYLAKGSLVLSGNVEQAKEEKTNLKGTRSHRDTDEGESMQKAAAQSAGQAQRKKPETFQRSGKKIGRNDPCHCGSGKKYKQCHGR